MNKISSPCIVLYMYIFPCSISHGIYMNCANFR